MERRADVVALLEDNSIFHFEFQSRNDSRIHAILAKGGTDRLTEIAQLAAKLSDQARVDAL